MATLTPWRSAATVFRLLLPLLLACSRASAQSTLTTPERTANPCEQVPPDSEQAIPCTFPSTPSPLANGVGYSGDQTDDQGRPDTPGGQAYSTQGRPLPTRRPPLKKTEFEIFAEDVIGHPIFTYGRTLFDDVPSTFAPLDHVPVPADYVVGPGDQLLIRAWGKIDLNAHTTIDRNGQISLPKVGTLNVAGLRYEQLQSYLHSAIGALFKDFQLNVALGRLRSIQIYVLGSARRPGAYTVGSLSTMVNALFVSGGPSPTGSMRRITLLRNNQVLTELDLYDLLKQGDRSHDRPLLPGDILFIPPAGPQAAVAGSVAEPGIYELGANTTVASALAAAGGLTSLAATRRAVLERVEDHDRRRSEEFALDASGLARPLHDGDLLQILPVSPELTNTVTLRGNVAQPGRYTWRPGMRVSDLIPSRDFLLTREYWNRENHVVAPGGKHQFGDPRLPSYSDPDAEDRPDASANRKAAPTGAPLAADRSNPNLLDPGASDPSAEAEDQLFGPPSSPATNQTANVNENSNSGDNNAIVDGRTRAPIDIVRLDAEINWRYASIERLDTHDLSPRLIPFQLGEAIDHHDSPDNQPLAPGDVVTIFSRADIPLPVEAHATFVRIGGEVNAPGVYRVNPGDKLRDAVRMAGGLTPHSYLYASQLLRVSTRRLEEEQLRRSTEQMQRELAASFANSAVPANNKDADQMQLSLRQAMLARIAAIKPTGRVVLEMKPDASTLDDIPDFTLEDGDRFYIPPRSSTIQVSGAVYNENAFRYQENKTAPTYLADAGGATRDADIKRMFLVRADGTVISRQTRGRHQPSFDKATLLPGDAIIIPVRLNAGEGWKRLEALTAILSQTSLTGASLAVITK